MRKRVIAERYAAALLEVAARCNEMTDVYNELLFIKKISADNPTFIRFLENPRIVTETKKDFIGRFLSTQIRRNLVNFIYILIDKARIKHLGEIIEEYQKLYNKKISRLELTLVTAVPMKSEIIEILKNKLAQITQKKIEMKVKVEPLIIGGIILMTGNTILDGSIRKKLYDLGKLMNISKQIKTVR